MFPFIIVFVLIVVFFIVFIVASRYASKKRDENRSTIEANLAAAGFNISRCVGRKVGTFDTGHYSLYVDDVNKKWVIAQYDTLFMDKIRDFNELVDFVFFDEEASNIFTKAHDKLGNVINKVNSAGKGGLAILGAIAGAGLGAALVTGSGGSRVKLGAVIGGVFGGVGMSRLAEMQRSQPKMSSTSAYGYIIQTTDGDVNSPVLVFNFMDLEGKKGTKKPPMMGRHLGIYKKDIKTIAETLEVLSYIQASGQ